MSQAPSPIKKEKKRKSRPKAGSWHAAPTPLGIPDYEKQLFAVDHTTPFCVPAGKEPPSNKATYMSTTPPKIVSRYNYKGGVGKTTSCFTSAYEVALKFPDKNVMMVDADSQCNLTQYVLGRSVKILTEGKGDYERYFSGFPHEFKIPSTLPRFGEAHNIFKALKPFFKSGSSGDPKPAHLISVGLSGQNLHEGQTSNLYLLPGSQKLTRLTETLTRAAQDPAGIFRGIIGAFYHLMWMTAAHYQIDIIFVDLSPALDFLTRTVIMSSQFLIVPFLCDSFSLSAVKELSRLLRSRSSPIESSNNPSDSSASKKRKVDTEEDDEDDDDDAEDDEDNWVLWYKTQYIQEKKAKVYPLPEQTGPRFLGGHLTKFTYKPGAKTLFNMTKMEFYWQQKIQKAFEKLNELLPDEMKARYPPELTSLDDFPPLVVGIAENYNQLMAIALRESLPPTRLSDITLCLVKEDEDGNPYEKKQLPEYNGSALIRHQHRFTDDLRGFVDRFKRLVFEDEPLLFD